MTGRPYLQTQHGTLGMPMCAVCKKPVDRLEMYYDIRRCRTVYVAYCHGDQQEVALNDAMVVNADGISVGEAFAGRPRLPAPPRLLQEKNDGPSEPE